MSLNFSTNLSSSQDIAGSDPLFEFWVPGVMLNIVGVLGLVGNIISIVILSRPLMKSSLNFILLGLASFDTVLILTSVLMFGLPGIQMFDIIYRKKTIFSTYTEVVFPVITPYVYPIGLLAQTGSVYLTVCVTLERYVAVCKPMKAKLICTYRRAKVAVAVITAVAVGYNMPRFWEITNKKIKTETHRYRYEVVPSDLRQNKYYIEVYINWMYLIFIYLIPFSILAGFNTVIFCKIREANTNRSQLTRSERRERGLAMMLICVVFIFFLCNILALVVNVLEHMGYVYYPLTQTSNLLVTINSSVNFIIYCIFGEKFKKVFFLTFCTLNRAKTNQREDWARLNSVYHTSMMLQERKKSSVSRNPSDFMELIDHRKKSNSETPRPTCCREVALADIIEEDNQVEIMRGNRRRVESPRKYGIIHGAENVTDVLINHSATNNQHGRSSLSDRSF